MAKAPPPAHGFDRAAVDQLAQEWPEGRRDGELQLDRLRPAPDLLEAPAVDELQHQEVLAPRPPEIQHLHQRYGIREIHIEDDNFTWDRDFVIRFSRAMRAMPSRGAQTPKAGPALSASRSATSADMGWPEASSRSNDWLSVCRMAAAAGG